MRVFEQDGPSPATLDRFVDCLVQANPLWAMAEMTVITPADQRVLVALLPFVERAVQRGARLGRVTLVLASPDGDVDPAPGMAAQRRFPNLRVHTHSPDRSAFYPVDVDGVRIDLDDALRETEVLLMAGFVDPANLERSLTRLLVPGLCPREMRDRFAQGPDPASLASRFAASLPIDFVIGFHSRDSRRVHVGPLAALGDAWS